MGDAQTEISAAPLDTGLYSLHSQGAEAVSIGGEGGVLLLCVRCWSCEAF